MENLTLPDFKICYKATVTKNVRYLYKNRYVEQWKRMNILDISLHTYGQLIFDKDIKVGIVFLLFF